MTTGLEHAFWAAWQAYGDDLPDYAAEARMIPGRKFRADFGWPKYKLAVEIQGGIYTKKAHGSISGVEKDMVRTNVYTEAGVWMLRFGPKDLVPRAMPATIDTVRRTLVRLGWEG